MRNMRFMATCLLICLTTWAAVAQKDKTNYAKPTEADLAAADAAKGADYLTEKEKQVYYYMNLARMFGPFFADIYVKDYLKNSDVSNTEFVKSLQESLRNQKPLPPLQPAKDLYEEARTHATEMGTAGRKGSNSLAGKDLKTRFATLQKTYPLFAENCDYGNAEAIDIVFSLLINEGMKSLKNRKNILNPEFNHAGVSIAPHKKLEWNCVIDLGKKN